MHVQHEVLGKLQTCINLSGAAIVLMPIDDIICVIESDAHDQLG